MRMLCSPPVLEKTELIPQCRPHGSGRWTAEYTSILLVVHLSIYQARVQGSRGEMALPEQGVSA